MNHFIKRCSSRLTNKLCVRRFISLQQPRHALPITRMSPSAIIGIPTRNFFSKPNNVEPSDQELLDRNAQRARDHQKAIQSSPEFPNMNNVVHPRDTLNSRTEFYVDTSR